MKTKTLAIDPGGTNGIARCEQMLTIQTSIDTIIADQVDGKELDLWNYLVKENPTHIVYEAFTFRQGVTGIDYAPAERIGVIKLYCQLYGITSSSMTSAEGKNFWVDKKIKALGLWVPGLKHGMDATRILLAHLMKNNQYKQVLIELLKDKL
ncbi:MAG TPA: hypothetical protein V6C65_17975 [Allocoleopsis sp.]